MGTLPSSIGGPPVTTLKPFTGSTHAPMRSPLAAAERRFIDANLHRIPPWIGSHHLTLLTLAWSALLVAAAALARATGSLHWFWLSSLMIFLQWLTDSFDGSLGRARGAGLRRWGYHMDHFLDYIFMACVCGHYALVAGWPGAVWFLLLVPLYAAFEVNSWLEFGATGLFKITYAGLGPTEIRIFFIGVNTAVIFAGIGWAVAALPWFLAVLALLLVAVVWRTQRAIWAMDMAEKAASE